MGGAGRSGRDMEHMKMAQLVGDESRDATCVCCGVPFKQVRLGSGLYMASMRLAALAGAERCAMEREIPDGWVPLYCVPCERYELTRTGELQGSYESEAGRMIGIRQRDNAYHKDRRDCCEGRRRANAGPLVVQGR